MKEYVITVVFAVIVCLGAGILTPGGKYRGVMKIICGIFVVYNILSPLHRMSGADFAADISPAGLTAGEFSDISARYARSFNETVSQNGSAMLSDAVSKDLSAFTGVAIKAELIDNSLYVYGVPDAERENVRNFITEQYGIEAVFG